MPTEKKRTIQSLDSRLLQGTLGMLILEVLAHTDSYGYEITQTVMAQSSGAFDLKEGSLYPALHRLEREKLLTSFWVESGEGRRRKYYRITARGRKTLAAKRDDWTRFSRGVNGILGVERHVVA